MDKTTALALVRKYARAVNENFRPKRIILFGSYAKGTFHEESDIDVAVVFSDYDDSIDMQLELMRLRRKIDSRIEPHPYKEKDFTLTDPVVYEIITHGQMIEEN